MAPISVDELRKISYLDVSVIGQRTVNMMPTWDGEHWHMWVHTPVGLIKARILDTTEGDYVAKSPARPTDLFIPFIHIMWQQASWPEVCPLIIAISEDFHNMGTSIAKLRHFCKFRAHIRSGGANRFALTELEYIVTLARTVFDLLQELFSLMWKRVQLDDTSADAFRKGHPLPETFSKMVLIGKNEIRTVDQIQTQFGLPKPIAEHFAEAAVFFSQLRKIRDRVIHGRSGFGHVFETERGFCVDPKREPFKSFTGWLPEHYYNENIVSVLPWIADTIFQTIKTCDGLMSTFSAVLRFPPPIAPEYSVFVRGPHNDALAELLAISSGSSAWWDDAELPLAL